MMNFYQVKVPTPTGGSEYRIVEARNEMNAEYKACHGIHIKDSSAVGFFETDEDIAELPEDQQFRHQDAVMLPGLEPVESKATQ